MGRVAVLFGELLLLVAAVNAGAQPLVPPAKMNKSSCYPVSALFVFGDSTVDPGNNDYLATPMKSNFPPYGRDFPGHLPTGRFTNGKLATDLVASYLGIKESVPPYLDWTLSMEELETGVSFASAGSGFDPLTAQISGVIPVLHQLDYFKDYLFRLDILVGRRKTEDIVRRSIFVVSAGTNDFIVNYFALPIRQQMFSVEDYQFFLLQNVRTFIEELMKLGAKKIVIVGLPPMGCLPLVITVDGKGGFHDRGCLESFNAISRDYNVKLQTELSNLQGQFFSGGKIAYADIYHPVLDMVTSPSKYAPAVCVKPARQAKAMVRTPGFKYSR
ncbi:GDSL esterase/lipase At5g45960-like isoform X2 [Wolffia australiana]